MESSINTLVKRRMSMSKDSNTLFSYLRRLETNVMIQSVLHYETSFYYERLFYYLHYPALVISIIVNSALFTKIYDQESKLIIFFIGNVISIFCSILIGIQNYCDFEKKKNIHSFYAKEYSRMYRVICKFYERNLIEQNEIHKKYLWEFIHSIQSQTQLLSEDSPKCPQTIIKKIYTYNIDIYFYVVNTQCLKHKYTYDNIYEISKICTSNLRIVMNHIQYDMNFHKRNSGHYRFIMNDTIMSRKDILNFIILEKNISYSEFIHIYSGVLHLYETNSENENTIQIFETDDEHYKLKQVDEFESDEIKIEIL